MERRPKKMVLQIIRTASLYSLQRLRQRQRRGRDRQLGDAVGVYAPPLVVVGVKTNSGTYQTVKAAGNFALNMLGKDQKALAFTFFRPADVSDGTIDGHFIPQGHDRARRSSARRQRVGYRVTSIVEQGDRHCRHSEVVEARLHKPPAGRPERRDPGNEGPGRQRVLHSRRTDTIRSGAPPRAPHRPGEGADGHPAWSAERMRVALA